jgi:hypothetical protein
MQYGGDLTKITVQADGNLLIQSEIGGVKETRPVSFYGNSPLSLQQRKDCFLLPDY